MRPPHIAIVDDDESVCRSVSRLLRQMHMEATAFHSVPDFLDSPMRTAFTCLVLDVQLGTGMTGFELRQHLLERGDCTPAIFLTAYDDPQTQAQAKRFDSAIVRKGADPQSLIEAIRKAKRPRFAFVPNPQKKE